MRAEEHQPAVQCSGPVINPRRQILPAVNPGVERIDAQPLRERADHRVVRRGMTAEHHRASHCDGPSSSRQAARICSDASISAGVAHLRQQPCVRQQEETAQLLQLRTTPIRP